MKKIDSKKLALGTETIRQLRNTDLSQVAGGVYTSCGAWMCTCAPKPTEPTYSSHCF